jgi:hypothetical protein
MGVRRRQPHPTPMPVVLHRRTKRRTSPVATCLALRPTVSQAINHGLRPAHPLSVIPRGDVTDHQRSRVLPAIDVARSGVVDGTAAHLTRQPEPTPMRLVALVASCGEQWVTGLLRATPPRHTPTLSLTQ